jgi:hypothetical protein
LNLKWEDGRNRERMLRATIVDISADGLRLQVGETVPLDSAVLFDAPDLGIFGKGSVRHCSSSAGEYLIGVECRGQESLVPAHGQPG